MGERLCSVEGCGQPHQARGWCRLHYFRWRRTGDPSAEVPKGRYGTDEDHRTCTKCSQSKPLEAFGRRNGGRWVKSWCRQCETAAAAAAYHADKAAHRERHRRWAIKKKYGITVEEYDEMLAAQGGGCGICGATECGGGRVYFCVDHDHETGVVRGLLCNHCNRTLGQLGDSLEALRRAVAYLERSAV